VPGFSIFTSHKKKQIQERPDTINGQIIVELLQLYREPPLSSAKTSSTEATRSKPAPERSTRCSEFDENLRVILVLKLLAPVTFPAGRKTATKTIAANPAGPLPGDLILNAIPFTQKDTHLSKNTHRQVVCVAIAPPKTGPTTLAIAKTDDTIPIYFPYSERGTKVGATTSVMA